MNPGTAGGGLRTVVGDRCAVPRQLACRARHARSATTSFCSNNVMLAGHVHRRRLRDLRRRRRRCIQFVRIGAHAFIGGMSGLENDLIPYGMALGNRAHLGGLNIIGLRRRGFTREQIHDIRRAYRLLFADEGTLSERVEDVAAEFATHPFVHEILDFIREGKDRAHLHAAGPRRRA